MDGCFTCEVNSGQRPTPGGPIYESGLWVADHGTPPLLAGYVVLKPRRHVGDVADLTPEESAGFGPAVRTVMDAIRSALRPERTYMCSFVETVPQHLHFHLLPRYSTMPKLGPVGLGRVFAGEWQVSESEAEQAAGRIRTALADAPE